MFRRIIKFGDSSHVVSLPKKWVDKNNLKKGDLIICEETDYGLRISPHGDVKKGKAREVTINLAENDVGRVRHKISSAYVNNFGIINLVAEDISLFVKEIRGALQDLMALEIIQQTSKKVVLKDFLDVKDVSILDTIRRIDRIILAISEDVLNSFKGKDVLESIKQKETDVNRLSFLLWKVLRKCADHRIRQSLDVTYDEVFYYWDIVMCLEKIADQLKRIPRYVDGGLDDVKAALVSDVINCYKLVMRSFYNSNLDLAVEVKESMLDMFKRCDDVLYGHGNSILAEKIKNMLQKISDIATEVILFPSGKGY